MLEQMYTMILSQCSVSKINQLQFLENGEKNMYI